MLLPLQNHFPAGNRLKPICLLPCRRKWWMQFSSTSSVDRCRNRKDRALPATSQLWFLVGHNFSCFVAQKHMLHVSFSPLLEIHISLWNSFVLGKWAKCFITGFYGAMAVTTESCIQSWNSQDSRYPTHPTAPSAMSQNPRCEHLWTRERFPPSPQVDSCPYSHLGWCK